MDRDLIFGKDNTERIVSIEVIDNQIILFKEMSDGSIQTEYRDNKFWILLPEKRYSNLFQLNGDQHYEWLFTCDTRERYLQARRKLGRSDFYSIWNPKENAMVYNGITYFKNMKIQDVSILAFDIESDGIKHTSKSEIYLISNTFRKQGEVINKLFSLEDYLSQAEMLEDWCKWVREINPSIVINHNIYGYDLPYLNHVANINGVDLNLGRDGSPLTFEERTSKFRVDGTRDMEFNMAYIFGREIVDSMFLSIRYDLGKAFESYGLKPIVKALGLEKEGRSFVDASQIKNYYKNRFKDPQMWEKVKAYASEDAEDVIKLFDIMMPSYFYFTQSVSKPFQGMLTSATGSQMNNILVRAYLQQGHSIAKADENGAFEGAISFGIPNLYKNGFKFDAASLYPSIMRQYEIYNAKKDPKGYFKDVVNFFALERLKNKKLAKETGMQYYKDLEQSQKIGANSLYGFLGAAGLNYNYPFGAAEVTRHGREILDKVSKFSTGKSIWTWKDLINDKED